MRQIENTQDGQTSNLIETGGERNWETRSDDTISNRPLDDTVGTSGGSELERGPVMWLVSLGPQHHPIIAEAKLVRLNIQRTCFFKSQVVVFRLLHAILHTDNTLTTLHRSMIRKKKQRSSKKKRVNRATIGYPTPSISQPPLRHDISTRAGKKSPLRPAASM